MGVAAVVAVAALVVVLWPGSSFDEPESVAALAERIDATVPGALREFHVPGAQVAVVADGAVRWSGAYGDAAPDTRFQVASVSKVVAAHTAVRLAEEGRLDLDAPVRGRPAGVTLRRLLSHTAGTDVPGYAGLPPGRPLPSTEQAAARVRVVREPGSGWAYSGGGYTIAQDALERTLRRPFAELVRDETFVPLGMRDSDFACAGTGRGHDKVGDVMPNYRFAELAAAGVCSTAADLGRLLVGVLREPAMARAQPATDDGFGLGLHLERLGDGTRMVWHDGANRGWQSYVAAFPERGWGIAVVTDGDTGGRVIERVLDLLIRRR